MKRLLNTLYVTNPDAYLRKKDDAIAVCVDHEVLISVPFHLLDGLVLLGHVGFSGALIGECATRGLSVVLLDESGRFQARVEGPVSGNVLLRREQYRQAADEERCNNVAKRFVAAKIHNSRALLQHFSRDYSSIREGDVPAAVDALKADINLLSKANSLEVVRGIEGDAARKYYRVFGNLLRNPEDGVSFVGRSKRPPTDPVNAALSLFYVIMSRDVATGCEAVGLDPQMGYLHSCRPGRASLALDLMEEFRAPYVDRFVLSLFNRRQIGAKDFIQEGIGYSFKSSSMRKVLALWQEKKKEQIVHPYLGERIKLGLLPFVQAQLFARYLRGDLDDYPAFLWR